MAIGLAAGLAVVAVAAGLGERWAARTNRTDRVTVIYWEKWNGSEGEEMRKVVDAFNRSQDRIFVRYLSISGVDRKTLLATAGGNPPDVAGLWGEQVPQFADANALTDLSSLATTAGLTRNTYIKGYWDQLFYRGGLWALPSTPASIALHVNADLVPARYATPETFPTTIEGLDAVVDEVSKKEGDGRLKLAGFMPSEPGWWHWAWGGWFGGSLISGDHLTVDSKENVRGFEWVQSYSKRFGSQQVQSFQSGFGNFSSPQDAFMSNKVATELHGVYKANYIRLYNPKMNWFAVPVPYPADRPDLKGHSVIGQDVLMIPRGSKHVAEAFEFIRFVQRQDVMEGLCAAHGKNSPLARVSDKFLRTHPNKFIALFDQLARSPGAIAAPQIGIYPQINAEINVAFEQVNSGQKSPKEALHEAQTRLDGQWKIYREQVLAR